MLRLVVRSEESRRSLVGATRGCAGGGCVVLLSRLRRHPAARPGGLDDSARRLVCRRCGAFRSSETLTGRGPSGLSRTSSTPRDLGRVHRREPWWSAFFRLWSPWLPKAFQFTGLWFLLCYLLQGIFGARLCRSVHHGQALSSARRRVVCGHARPARTGQASHAVRALLPDRGAFTRPDATGPR